MGSITSAGVGSGIDIESLVQKLVAAEGQGTRTRLDTREAQLQARLSAYGVFRNAIAALRTALAPLKDLAKFQGRTTTLSTKDYLGATATSASATGSHAIEVVRLAQAHRLASGPYATSDTVVGEGTLTLTADGTSTLITIDSSNHTLAGIRDAINAASDNPGVTASLVTANDGVRLVLSSRDTGAASAITLTQSGTLDALVYDPGGGTTNLTQLQAAQDARVIVDGFTYDSASNTVTGMLEGVTLTLLKQNLPGETTTLAIGEDRDGARKAVDEFVKAYNALVNGIRGLSAYNASTKSGGPLLGDSTLRNFNLGLRQELGAAAASAPEGFRLLAQVGITLKVDGTLEVNSSKLAAALDGGFDAVGSLFAATDGIATRLDALLERYVQSGGAIQARTDGLSASIKDVTQQRDALDRRLQLVEDRLRRQFTAMDTLVAQLRNTSSFLTQQLASLQSTGK